MCEGDPTPDWKHWVTWFPEEPICVKKPRSKIQKTQMKIQRLFNKGKLSLKGINSFYTGEDLERIRLVRAGITGRKP